MKEFELKIQGKIKRLTNKTFQFDPRVGQGWYSAAYFLKAQKIIAHHQPDQTVLLQFFQRSQKEAILCGVDESLALLKTFAKNYEDLQIYALHDGDRIKAYEPVLQITGKYQDFGFLEGVIDGILCRRTSVCTNVYTVLKTANDKPVIFMGDREDHFLQQQGDGYAAFIGGIQAQCTMAMNEWWGKEGVGTMPHALIQHFAGDLIQACKAYITLYPEDKLIALVDYHNDVVRDALLLARYFGKKLYGVRVDTSEYLIDNALKDHPEPEKVKGVSPALILCLRKALDEEGFDHVKIVVSGGFNAQKIDAFEKQKIPVDMYGVGSSLLKIHIGFTGDCVLLNGLPEAKIGRHFIENPRLEKVVD